MLYYDYAMIIKRVGKERERDEVGVKERGREGQMACLVLDNETKCYVDGESNRKNIYIENVWDCEKRKGIEYTTNIFPRL